MFDHVSISLFTGKDKPNLSYLTDTGNVWQGWQQYRLEGVTPLKVEYKPELKELRLKGSLPYFCRGHNFPARDSDLQEATEYVSQVLGLNVFAGYVESFEFGQFLPSPYPIKILLAHHNRLPGFVVRGYIDQSSKHFESSALRVKLYDAKQNATLKVKGGPKKALQEDFSLDPGKHWLKVENHYKKPEIYFKQRVIVANFFSPCFVDVCKYDLFDTYQSIQKTSSCNMPSSKKDLSASMVPLLVLKDLETEYGFNTEDLLNRKLKAIPDEVLTPDDRKARKRQIRKMLNQVCISTSVSPFDLSKELEQALEFRQDNV